MRRVDARGISTRLFHVGLNYGVKSTVRFPSVFDRGVFS